MVLRSKVRRMGIKVESVEGTAVTLTGSDYANHVLEDLTLGTMAELESRHMGRASYSKQPAVVGIRSYVPGFSEKIRGDGTAGAAPPFAIFLKACGWAETQNAAQAIDSVIAADDNSDNAGNTFTSGGTYTGTNTGVYKVEVTTGGVADGMTAKFTVTDMGPGADSAAAAFVTTNAAFNVGANGVTLTVGHASTATLVSGDRFYIVAYPAAGSYKYVPSIALTGANISYTINDDFDGMNHAIAGARGSVSFTFEVGKPGMANYNFQGKYAGPTTIAMRSVTDTNTQIPPAFLDAKVNIDGYAAELQQVTIDMGNALAPNQDATQATGIKSVLITGRETTGSITMRRQTPGTNDVWGSLISGTPLWMTFRLGTTAGNRFQVVGQIQYTGAGELDDNGIASLEVPIRFIANDNSTETDLILIAE